MYEKDKTFIKGGGVLVALRTAHLLDDQFPVDVDQEALAVFLCLQGYLVPASIFHLHPTVNKLYSDTNTSKLKTKM